MKVLQIGQLPKEMGGSYTTGIARVQGELCRHSYGDNVELVIYATNISEKNANRITNLPCKVLGYKYMFFEMVMDIVGHPLRTISDWKEYRKVVRVSPFHMHFYKMNLRRIINQIKPDIIHLHGGGILPLSKANKGTGIPIIHTHHGLMWDPDEPDKKNEQVQRDKYQYILPLAQYYTTLNQHAENKMLMLGVKKDKICIVPNGVDIKKYYYSPIERQTMRQKFGVNNSTKVFITAGKVIDRKGQFSFLRILEDLGLDYQYWIIGEGPDVDVIKQYISENRLEKKVRLIGYVKDTDIFKYHSAADFYSHASTIEGQALSEIEAYATGLRIIVNKKISNTVVGDINDSFIYYVADFSSIIKDEMIEWISMPVFGRKSRDKYDWSVIAKLYGNVYDYVFQHKNS